MREKILPLLLCLSLILNVIGAPWAMARVSDAGHPAHSASDHHAQPAVAEQASVAVPQMPHTGHHERGSPCHDASPAPQNHDAVDADQCCGGVLCQCGCVLPPAMAVVRLTTVPMVAAVADFVIMRADVVERSYSPPFRPPAA